MPIYEYECLDCRQAFELLIGVGSANGNGSEACPHCHSSQIKRRFSRFGVRSKGADGQVSSSSSGCSTCASSSCSTCGV